MKHAPLDYIDPLGAMKIPDNSGASMPLHDWADHYRTLFERTLHERDQYKGWLYDAWKTMRGQTKGLQRQRRLIRRLQAALAPTRDGRDIEIARLRAWIKGAPHRHDCPLRSLADRHQGQQHPCTCGRNHLLGDDL